jgi:hypothetical protein
MRGALHICIEHLGVGHVKFVCVLYYQGLWPWLTGSDFEDAERRLLVEMCVALQRRLQSKYLKEASGFQSGSMMSFSIGIAPPKWKSKSTQCNLCRTPLAEFGLLSIGTASAARHHCRHCGGEFCGFCCSREHTGLFVCCSHDCVVNNPISFYTVPTWFDLKPQRVCDVCFKELSFASSELSDEARAEIEKQQKEVPSDPFVCVDVL